MSRLSLTEIEAAAAEAGIDVIAANNVEAPLHYDSYRAWLTRGNHGEMHYLADESLAAARKDFSAVFENTRSVIACAVPYPDLPPGPAPPFSGVIARYAQGQDYHHVVRAGLETIGAKLAASHGVRYRAVVDTAPVLERDVALAAGLSFTGKNTMAIVPGVGSYFFIGLLLTDATIDAPSPKQKEGCGRCRSCLDACPTGAFDAAYQLDARKCIAYLTIEFEGVVPRPLRDKIGTMVFGCDICQAVCPFNARAPKRQTVVPSLRARDTAISYPNLLSLLSMRSAAYKRFTKNSALRRARPQQWRRNAAIALGNYGDARAAAALATAATEDVALVAIHAAWALGKLGAAAQLEQIASKSEDLAVKSEAQAALATMHK